RTCCPASAVRCESSSRVEKRRDATTGCSRHVPPCSANSPLRHAPGYVPGRVIDRDRRAVLDDSKGNRRGARRARETAQEDVLLEGLVALWAMPRPYPYAKNTRVVQ